MLVILLIGVARFEKGRTCKQQFKTVDLYWAKPVATGWFPVSTVARFTSIPNSLESVPSEKMCFSPKSKNFTRRVPAIPRTSVSEV